jgi:predicted PurR-regulated permease PerM
LGVVLIGLSLVWPAVSSGRSQWSDEQAREYQSVSAELHGLSHQLAHEQEEGGDVDTLAQKLQQANSEFDRLHQQLETAQQSPLRIASVLRFLGFVLIVVGAIVHYRDRFRRPA